MEEHDRKSWSIKDESVCEELVKLMKVDAGECALLQALQDEAKAQAESMEKDFHGRIFESEATKEFFDNVDFHRVAEAVKAWFIDIFSGKYDAGYARKRLEIGNTHVRIGLPVRYPLAMLDIVGNYGEAISKKSSDPDKALAAFRKVLALDVAVFNQAYEDNQLKHLAELVGGERLARRLLTGN